MSPYSVEPPFPDPAPQRSGLLLAFVCASRDHREVAEGVPTAVNVVRAG
jgi:hypothetical protein